MWYVYIYNKHVCITYVYIIYMYIYMQRSVLQVCKVELERKTKNGRGGAEWPYLFSQAML